MRKIRHELVEDVEHLLPLDGPYRTLLRLGRSAASVERGLRREGRHDLANPFGRIVREQRIRAGYQRPSRAKAA